MYTGLIFSILIAFAVKNAQNVKPPLTLEQVDLADGVVNALHWHDLWFNSIADEDEWMDVSRLLNRQARPGPVKKLKMIPLMMGCDYGLRFHWFLSLAVFNIGECRYLSLEGHDHTDDCWNKLADGLKRGSTAMSVTSRTLEKIHSIIGDNIDVDEFYNTLLKIQNLPTRHRVADVSAILQNGLNYVEILKKHTSSLQHVLITTCQPPFTPLNIEDLMNEHEGQQYTQNSYEFYASKMDSYIKYISSHLTTLGFSYDPETDRASYDPFFFL